MASENTHDSRSPRGTLETGRELREQQRQAEKSTPRQDARQEISEATVTSNPRLEALAAKKIKLEESLASLQAQKSTLVSEAKLPSGLDMPDSWSEEERAKSALSTADALIKERIALLHKYNEIKDIAQGLMGLIADKRGVRIAVVMEDYGMSEKD